MRYLVKVRRGTCLLQAGTDEVKAEMPHLQQEREFGNGLLS